ncbi:hypothetical protein [Pseudactinotalea sp.]
MYLYVRLYDDAEAADAMRSTGPRGVATRLRLDTRVATLAKPHDQKQAAL